MRALRRTTITAVLLALVASMTLAAPGVAAPAPVDPPRPAFYEAPAVLPSANGTLIRSEPMRIHLDPVGLTRLAFSTRRVLYKSTNRAGRPIAVSGVVLTPTAPYVGLTRRPIIGYAPGTQGLGDRCAPSRQIEGSWEEYELIFLSGMLAKGYAIAITDYEGLGTAGVHTYMDRVSQAHTTLDVVRAAQQLPGLDVRHPVGLHGYSQGGGAVAAAAELATSYAPELRIKGVSSGAAPADLARVAANLDGTKYAEYGLYGAIGLATSYGASLDPLLTPEGQRLFREVEHDCWIDMYDHEYLKSADFTVSGRSLPDLMTEEPWATRLDEQRIGRRKPAAPVLITHSVFDDVIPYSVGRELGRSWCRRGGQVRFSTSVAKNHFLGHLATMRGELAFFDARFAGLPMVSECWLL